MSFPGLIPIWKTSFLSVRRPSNFGRIRSCRTAAPAWMKIIPPSKEVQGDVLRRALHWKAEDPPPYAPLDRGIFQETQVNPKKLCVFSFGSCHAFSQGCRYGSCHPQG